MLPVANGSVVSLKLFGSSSESRKSFFLLSNLQINKKFLANFWRIFVNRKNTKQRSSLFDPEAGGPVTAMPEGHTCWDRLEVEGKGVTCETIAALLRARYGADFR